MAIFSGLRLWLRSPATEFLVLPPLSVIIYLIFREPFGDSANVRSIVVLPTLGAAVGQLCSIYLGLTPIGVTVACVVVIAAQAALRVYMPPAIALAVLAMLLHVEGPTYVLNVFEGTVAIAVVFFVWRHFAGSPGGTIEG
jgi:hypothetical protein